MIVADDVRVIRRRWVRVAAASSSAASTSAAEASSAFVFAFENGVVPT